MAQLIRFSKRHTEKAIIQAQIGRDSRLTTVAVEITLSSPRLSKTNRRTHSPRHAPPCVSLQILRILTFDHDKYSESTMKSLNYFTEFIPTLATINSTQKAMQLEQGNIRATSSPCLAGPGGLGGHIHNKIHAFTTFTNWCFCFLPVFSVTQLNDPPEHDQVKKWHALLVYMYRRVG